MVEYTKQLSNKDTILIVDDVVVSAVICENALKDAGFDTVVVNDATAALEYTQYEIPTLIVTNLQMPDINGIELCKLLKRRINTRDIPVIIVSGALYHDSSVRCFQAGAVDVIRKPYYAEELVERVKTHIQLFKKQKLLEDYNNNLYKLLNEQMRGILLEQTNIINGVVGLLQSKENMPPFRYEEYRKNCGILATGLLFSSKYDIEVGNTFIELIENVAPFANIGKVAIPDNIVTKQAPLTKEEEEIYKRHPEYGAKAFTDVLDRGMYSEFYKMAVQITYSHHENWDGSGYPKGLSGNDIPLAARIVAIIGSFEKLITPNYYRDGFTREEAAKKVIEGSGKYFDPDIICVFERIWKQLL